MKKILFLAILTLTVSLPLYARFGGGGGDDGGGSSYDGGSSDWSDDDSGSSTPAEPIHFVIAGGILIVFLIGLYAQTKKDKQRKQELDNELEREISRLKDFSGPDFLSSVEQLFLNLQKAWGTKDLSKVRRFMTDGMFQRSIAQLKMMDQLDQTNSIEEIKVIERKIHGLAIDGEYDMVHVHFRAKIKDVFTSNKLPKLNKTYHETFNESWTFIRKRNSEHKDLYNSQSCPNCGDHLNEEMADLSKCSSCGTILNSPEFDWILCEITQCGSEPERSFLSRYNFRYIEKDGKQDSLKILEDKASNAFTQIRTGILLDEKERVHRFCMDDVFEKIKQLKDPGILLNRYYITSCDLTSFGVHEDYYVATFLIHFKEQKVVSHNGKDFEIVDQEVIPMTGNISMIKKVEGSTAKYSAVAGNCNQCGAPVVASEDTTCSYCGNKMNDPDKDWIVSAFSFYPS